MINPYSPPSQGDAYSSALATIRNVTGAVVLTFAGALVGMNAALASVTGFERTIRKALSDPLGMILATCFVVAAAFLLASCYRAMRSSILPAIGTKLRFALPFGIVYGASMILALWGFSALLGVTAGAYVQGPLPAFFDLVAGVPAFLVAAIVGVEFEQLLQRRTARSETTRS